MTSSAYSVDRASLQRTAAVKYGDPPPGWAPAMRTRFGYFTPDDVYESLVDRVIAKGSRWLDVGCGRDVFPTNRTLARELSGRCGTLVGVDPDPTIQENPFVHARVQAPLEGFETNETFDVITARMVVEHVQQPEAFAGQLRRLSAPGGLVVLYTVNKWAPVSALSWLVPFALHHRIKSLLWGTMEKDTFPVEYRMNTRSTLRALMGNAGFRERHFEYLDDCRTLAQFRWGSRAELVLWKLLNSVGMHYPETCLLAVYQRSDD
jgi:2-polyprenyl-3-methyl-5-hydroxy-6-metoxy-1,4-benzoquinol methylase